MSGGPLEGIRVVELGRYIAAPFAARLLGDWGADVIKVESPEGDPMRWGPGGDRPGYSPVFASFNRNKRGLTLDLKTDSGRRAFARLLGRTDALVHNLRPAAMARLGVDDTALRREFPQLITCGVNGFGSTGPFANVPTFDAIVSAGSGLYSQLAALDDLAPTGPSWSDLLTGFFAAQGVLAALVERQRDDAHRGQVVDVSMLGSLLATLDDSFTAWFETGAAIGPRTRQARQQVLACHTSDGRPFVVQIGSDEAAWGRFCGAVGGSLAADERFATYPRRLRNFEALSVAVGAATRARRRDEWLAVLGGLDISCGPINTVEEAVADERALAADAFVDIPVDDGPPLRMTRPAGTFTESGAAALRPPPDAGADTPAVLAELGLDVETSAAVELTWAQRRRHR